MENKRKKKFSWKFLIVIPVVLAGMVAWEFGNSAPHQACACAPDEDYLVHFTDEQALVIIRDRLEEVGLNFDNEVPAYTVERHGGRRWGWENGTGIDFFDAERNIAITFINHYADTISSATSSWGSRITIANQMAEEFAKNFEGIHFGVFYNASVWRPWDMQRRWFAPSPHTESEVERLTERLINQIDYFIDQLRADGVLD